MQLGEIMLGLSDAKKIVHSGTLKPSEQLMVLLALDPVGPTPVKLIKERCISAGLPKLAKAEISNMLIRAVGFVARVGPAGWELQQAGWEKVNEFAFAANVKLVINQSSRSLRNHASVIKDDLTRSFVMESIHCFEAAQYRAAVVFSWAGAIALIHKHVFKHKLNEFNVEMRRREPKWRDVKQTDDFGRAGERQFLDVCEVIGVVGNNIKQVLQNECLLLRNSCGHPNRLKIAENSVASHIEKLIHNVFTEYEC